MLLLSFHDETEDGGATTEEEAEAARRTWLLILLDLVLLVLGAFLFHGAPGGHDLPAVACRQRAAFAPGGEEGGCVCVSYTP